MIPLKKLKIFIFLLTLIINLTACGTQSITPMPQPTLEPTHTLYPPAEVDIADNSNIIDMKTPYIGNKKSKKFHRTNCYSLPAEKNRVELSSCEEAINRGFVPCKHCNP